MKDDPYMTEIITKKYWQSQKSLNLSGFKDDDFLMRLFSCRDWSGLKNLYLNGCQLEEKAFQIIIKYGLNKLVKLSLESNKITCSGLQVILNNNNLINNIEQLYLKDIAIGNNGIKIIAKAFLPNLKILSVIYSGIGSEGTQQLSKGIWPLLSTIYLYGNQINNVDNNFLSLVQWNQQLKFYEFSRNAISALSFVCGGFRQIGLTISYIPYNFQQDIKKILEQKNIH